MKTQESFLKILDEYELGIFAAKSFAEVTKGIWTKVFIAMKRAVNYLDENLFPKFLKPE